MKLLNRYVGLGLFLSFLIPAVTFSAGLHAESSETSAVETARKEFTLCQRADGSVPTTIDLLLLFDNSRSLNSRKSGFVPTDPNNTRFTAVEKMFEAIATAISESNATVNLGLIKFGSQATRLIDFGDRPPISTVNSKKLAKEIRDLMPPKREAQEPDTNYIKALNAAQQMFEASDGANCRVMVWFTDGAFDFGDPKKADEKLDDLKRTTCAADGWPTRFRELSVNSFVVLLGKPKSDTLKASLELMQALTGHPNGVDGNDSLPVGCGGAFSGDGKQVGIVSRGSADTLGPLFEEIGTRIGGGKLLTACSESGLELQTGKMPATKFLKFVKIISRGGAPLPKPDDLVVIQSGLAEKPISEFMEPANTSSSSLQWVPNMGSPVAAGWQLRVKGRSQGICLYGSLIDPLIVKLNRVADGPVSIEEPTNRLDSSDKKSIKFKEADKNLTPSEVLDRYIEAKGKGTTPEIRAELVVDLTNLVFPEQLAILVQTDDPIPDLSKCIEALRFESPALLGDMPKNKEDRIFRSTPCVVATRGTSTEVSVDASRFFSAMSETKGCREIEPTLVIGDKRATSGKGVIPKDTSRSVSLLLQFKGSKADCKVDVNDGVVVAFELPSGGSKQRDLTVSLTAQLAPAPNPWWVIIGTAITVLFAALLSLILLRMMNKWLARLPEPQGLFSYEIEITVDFDDFQSVVGKVGGIPLASYQPQAKDLRPVISGSASEMRLQSTHLIRRLPSLFKPFSEASAVIAKDETAAYWQQTPSGGLAIPFSSAVIIQKSIKTSPSSGVAALLTIVVPRNGLGSGIGGVEKILKGSKLSDLLKNFRNNLVDLSVATKPSGSRGVDGNSQSSPSGPKKLPPPPSRPPLPPRQ